MYKRQIDDYREIDMELPVLDGTGKPTAATTRQTIGMSHFPRLSALTEEPVSYTHLDVYKRQI